MIDRSFRGPTEKWDQLGIPVSLAFFFFQSSLDRWVAFYPSPAGAVESELPPDKFLDAFAECALVAHAEPDVEAILVRKNDCLLVPIDECYRLIAAIRSAWSGIGGGREVEHRIDEEIDRLRLRGANP